MHKILVTLAFAGAVYGQKPAVDTGNPLGRQSPRMAMIHFLESAHARDYSKVAKYLDLRKIPAADRVKTGEQVARDLEDLLDDTSFDIALLSRDPAGDEEDGLGGSFEHLDTFEVDGQKLDLQMEREELRPGLNVWGLVTFEVFYTPVWRWTALVLMGAAVWFTSGFVSKGLVRMLRPLTDASAFRGPLRLCLVLAGFREAMEFAAPASLPRLLIERALALTLSLGLAWAAAAAIAFYAGSAALLSASLYADVLIVTLTMNPAVDRTIAVDRLAFDDRAYILSSKDSPGGRGINAARVISSFGGQTLAILPAGGERGARFEQYLEGCGFPVATVPIRNDIRLNLTITDRHGLTIKLNEIGPKLDRGEISSVEGTVEAQLASASWLMLCGSLPPGVPSDFYAQLIIRARKKNVRTLLDTDGEALSQGIEANPTVVTPNQQEAERLLNTVLLTRSQSIAAARRIQSLGAESVVLSLASRGAIGVRGGITGAEMWEAIPPRVDAISPIGAGDALAAALLWSQEQGHAFEETLRWGVAAGTASAKLPGMSFASLEQTREMLAEVDLRQVHV